MGRRVIKFY